MSVLARLRGVVGVALAQLRHDRTRTVLATVGVALAVLATTMLASVGVGVVETGQQKFEAADRDLWVTGGPVRLAPGQVGGVQNSVVDAHPVAANISQREEVSTAVPLAFQTVYVAANRSGEYRTLVGAGAPARGSSVRITNGSGFSSRDVHYAGGSYDGPMTREVVIDSRTAALLDVGVNDTIYVGGTIATARDHEFRVVGVSPTYSRFLGAPTVTLHLSELQEVTGATDADRATMITISLQDGADPEQVARDLEAASPGYDVRTNREQLRATLERQAVVVASGASLVALAVVAGLALTVNLLLSMVYQQRETLAALRALGATSGTLAGVVTVQAVLIGVAGGALGVALTPPAVAGLNAVAHAVVGFETLVQTPRWVYEVGFGIAVVVSAVGAAAAGLRIASLDALEQLR